MQAFDNENYGLCSGFSACNCKRLYWADLCLSGRNPEKFVEFLQVLQAILIPRYGVLRFSYKKNRHYLGFFRDFDQESQFAKWSGKRLFHRINLCQQGLVIAQRPVQGSAVVEAVIMFTAQMRYAV